MYNSLKIKKLKMKNFLSIGNSFQEIDFDSHPLVLILGENRDVSNDGSRNGAGKTTIAHALSYAIYGDSLTNIKKDNLINKCNGKNMEVILEFEKNGVRYRIERGRKPNYLNFFVNDKKMENNEEYDDESEGDSRNTQRMIEKVFGISKELFRHIVVLNTYVVPFLSLPLAMQRSIIEELLGISTLSLKAEILKEKIKETKQKCQEEEIRIKTLEKTNQQILETIKDLEKKREIWIKNREIKLEKLHKKLKTLEEIDIEKELEYFDRLEKVEEIEKNLKHVRKYAKMTEKQLASRVREMEKIEENKKHFSDKKCPMCGQKITRKKDLEKHIEELNERKKNLEKEIDSLSDELKKYEETIGKYEVELNAAKNLLKEYSPFYRNRNEAFLHRKDLELVREELQKTENDKNPYDEQIEYLKENNLVEIDYSTVNRLNRLLEHQKLLLKFLTAKNSFIRKKIIEQNINFMNKRLKYYTKILGLNHVVEFQPDLSVNITESGLEYDYDNLSRGEKTRVNIALSLAFRELFEHLNHSINLLFIDEIIDNGLDYSGVTHASMMLEKIARTMNKNVFLISHREELMDKMDMILFIVKENGFTTINM